MSVLIGVLHSTANKGVGPPGAGLYQLAGGSFVASATGTATSMSVRLWYGSNSYIFAVYDSAGTTKLGETGTVARSGTGTTTASFTSSFAVSSGVTYILVWIIQSLNTSIPVQSNNDGTDSIGQQGLGASSAPATVSLSYTGNNLGVAGVTVDGTLGGGDTNATLIGGDNLQSIVLGRLVA